MEKNYVVMTDSSADLNPALEQELGVDIIPLSVNCGDRTFLDKDVLYLGFSSGLSSTYSASEIAAQELRERYPERKVLTVDTLCASMGQGLLVWLTVQELKHGATLEEAAKYAEDNRLHLCHWFTVDDLFFLKRGGRVSAATALVGFISHGDCLADAEFLAQEVRRRLHVPRIEINYVGPVIGAHSGPGTLALFFLGTER